MNYTTQLGRCLLKKHHQVPNPMVKKWGGVLPANFRLLWKTVWPAKRVRKEAGLLWLIWHRAVAINHWRGQIYDAIDIRCPICPRRSDETVLHQFGKCLSAQYAWQWRIHILNALVVGAEAKGPWRPLNWKQGIFSTSIPRKFN